MSGAQFLERRIPRRPAEPDEARGDGGVVERIAERIARGKPTRPKGLRRFETAPN